MGSAIGIVAMDPVPTIGSALLGTEFTRSAFASFCPIEASYQV
jgi:hypothetical protein